MVKITPRNVAIVVVASPKNASNRIVTNGVKNAKLDTIATDPVRVALSQKTLAKASGPIPIIAIAIH